jgi:hypothetical protein
LQQPPLRWGALDTPALRVGHLRQRAPLGTPRRRAARPTASSATPAGAAPVVVHGLLGAVPVPQGLAGQQVELDRAS